MKGKFMMGAACLALLLGSCVKNEESQSVTNIRDAKAEQLKSVAALNTATAEATKTLAEADAALKLAQAKAAVAASQTKVDTTSGIDSTIPAVQKTAAGNYIMEVNGLGFAYKGDPDHYLDGKNIPIQICLVVSADGTVLNCLTVSQQESGGYGDACGKEDYYGQYVGKTEGTLSEVDAIAGATITSSGYRAAVRKCLQAVIILEGGAK